MKDKIRKLFIAWAIGGITGIGTALSFKLIHDGLTTDNMFDLWELGVALITPLVVGMIVTACTKYPRSITVAIAYLTLFIPVLGPLFGGTGSEPLWQFGLLGLIGGLGWGTLFGLAVALSKPKSEKSSES